MTRSFAAILAVGFFGVTTPGCIYEEEAKNRVEPGETPGGHEWTHDEDVSCAASADCATGEVCESGVCQMQRCAQSYKSAAPMGENHYFGTDGEFAIISDNSFIDAFEAEGGGYLDSWDLKGAKVVDVTGGALTSERPHTIAVAVAGDSAVLLNGPKGLGTIALPFVPVALASGDVNADGLDELAALSSTGEIALCNVEVDKCVSASLDGTLGKDIAIADVDADGFGEPVVLIEAGEESQVIVWNTDAEKTGQEASRGWVVEFKVRALGAGDLDGKGRADLVLLEDRGWWGFSDDRVHVFSPTTEAFTTSQDVSGGTIDVAVGDRNADGKAEVAVLRDDHKFEILGGSGAGLSSLATYAINVGETAQRVSVVDWNGDSASGRLLAGPELVPGNAVPIAVLMLPPYQQGLANGTSDVQLGSTESTSEGVSSSVALNVGMTISYGAEFPLFEAEVGAFFGKDFSYTETVTKSKSVGQTFSIVADPKQFGGDYAAVVLSCGCYHKYRYVTEDPKKKLGGDGQTADIYVPVGGQTQLWSSKRYNAMARALGTLPEIPVTVSVGNLSSYPKAPQNLMGQPVASNDLVFLDTPTFSASDVGSIGFALGQGVSTANESATTTTIGVSGSINVGGFGVEGEASLGVTQGYSIEIGKETEFSGSIPPVPDDPNTPEDEFALGRYTFTPIVHRQHYTNAAGEDAAYYVLHYAVGK